MASQKKEGPFVLSTDRIDFGIAGPGDCPRRTITLTNRSGGEASVQFAGMPPWVKARLVGQTGNRLKIELAVEPACLPSGGRHSSPVEIQVGNWKTEVHLAVTVAGTSSSGKRKKKSDSPKSSQQREGKKPQSTKGLARRPSQLPGLSVLATGGVLLAVLGPIYQATLLACEGTEAATFLPWCVSGGVGVVIGIVAILGTIPPTNRTVDPLTKNPEYRRVLDGLSRICERAGVPQPRVVIRPDASPNVYSTGLIPGMSCVYVNQGLLRALTGPGELEAALAHEVAHLKRLDTVYFAFVLPGFKVARWIGGATFLILFHVRRSFLGRGPSPFASMMMLHGAMRAGLWGCLIALMALAMFVFLAMMAATYAGMALLVILIVAAICLAYCRYIEKEADLEAARLVDDPDLVLVALAKTVDHYPSELRNLETFVARHLQSPADYSLADIVHAIKAGGRPSAHLNWVDRNLRGHPFVVERIGNVLKSFGSGIG